MVVAILDWSLLCTLSKFERCYLAWFWQELGFLDPLSSELNPLMFLSLLGYSSHKLSTCTSVDQFLVRTNWVQFALCTSYICIIIQNAAANYNHLCCMLVRRQFTTSMNIGFLTKLYVFLVQFGTKYSLGNFNVCKVSAFWFEFRELVLFWTSGGNRVIRKVRETQHQKVWAQLR
jgi:hypothetical protein